MAWTTPMTAVNGQLWTAAQWNTHIRDNFAATCGGLASAANRWFVSTGAGAVAERVISADTNTDDGTTTSNSYTSTLSGSAGNCTVTVTTGTQALVFFACSMSNSGSTNSMFMSVAVSGATTIAASDDWAWQCDGVTAANANRGGSMYYYGNGTNPLNAGSNTFTAQFRTGAGTLTVNNSEIVVFAM